MGDKYNSRILVISAHPDDEALGCGGTIFKHREKGDILTWMIVTQAYEPKWSKALVEKKSREVDEAAALYGMSEVYRLGFPTTTIDAIALDDIIDKMKPPGI